MSKKYELITFKDGEFSLDVRADQEGETVWLSVEQIASLFDRDITVIRRHIRNIFLEKELEEKVVSANFAHTTSHGAMPDKEQTHYILFYNLDVIISVGYRVKSKKGVLFRKWANSVLKDYLIKGYAVNEKRMIALNKTIDVQTKMLAKTLDIETEELSSVISEYTKALDLLDDYDHQCVKEVKGTKATYILTYEECRKLINSMKFGDTSSIFGVEKEEGKLNGILAAVYQNVFGEEIYSSLESKAAHLLYFLVKDHPFVDGCKRIAATLFLEFLNRNNALVKNNQLVISNDALVAITLLTAESKPEEIEIIIQVIINLLAK